MNEIREIRNKMNLSQQKFGNYFGIPLRTVQRWEYGESKPSVYVVNMIKRILELENLNKINKGVNNDSH